MAEYSGIAPVFPVLFFFTLLLSVYTAKKKKNDSIFNGSEYCYYIMIMAHDYKQITSANLWKWQNHLIIQGVFTFGSARWVSN